MRILFLTFLFLLLPFSVFAGGYDVLAKDLVKTGHEYKGKRVVIIPFKTAENMPDYAGAAAAAKLNETLSLENFYTIVSSADFATADMWVRQNKAEGSYALNLMDKLQTDLAITGEMSFLENDFILLKVKLLSISAKKILVQSSTEIQNEWQKQYYEVQERKIADYHEQNSSRANTALHTENTYENFDYGAGNSINNDYLFFDLLYGLGGSSYVDMDFKKDYGSINLSDFNLTGISGSASSLKLSSVDLENNNLAGFRFGVFQDYLGFDIGFRYGKYESSAQNAETNLSANKKTVLREKYIKLKSYEINADFFLRFIKTSIADIYAGLGMGINILSVELPYVKGATNGSFKEPVKETGMGLAFRLPFGARWKITKSLQLVTECSLEASTTVTSFTRGLPNENDSYTIVAVKPVIGLGYAF